MKHIILPLAFVVSMACAPCWAGGLFAGDENMHVQGHPYEASSYHKAFHGADSFQTLPVHFMRSGYGYADGYTRNSGCGHGYGGCGSCDSCGGCGHFGGGHFGSLFHGWFNKCCGQSCGGCESDCGCEEPSCCQPKCHKPLFNFSWFKKGCGCGSSSCDTCGGEDSFEGAFPSTDGEVIPEPMHSDGVAPIEADDAPPVPNESSAQLRDILPPAGSIIPTSVLFPFLNR